jgi:hypothetical protein
MWRADLDVVLLGDCCGPGIAGRDSQIVDSRVLPQTEQQGVFAGTGTDYEDAHEVTP